MATAVWTGTLSFGLITLPVRLYPATQPKDVRFHLYDREGRRIRYQRVVEAEREPSSDRNELPSPEAAGGEDAELAADDRRDPRAGPEIGGEAGGLRATQEVARQAPLRAPIEFRRPPRRGDRLEPRRAPVPGGGLPAPHRAAIDAEAAPDVHGREPLLEEDERMQATLFQLGGTAVWAHGAPPTGNVGHYLSRRQ